MFALLLYFPCWAIMHMLIGIKPSSHLSPWQWASLTWIQTSPGGPVSGRVWVCPARAVAPGGRGCTCYACVMLASAWWCFSVCLSSCERPLADWSCGAGPRILGRPQAFFLWSSASFLKGSLAQRRKTLAFVFKNFFRGGNSYHIWRACVIEENLVKENFFLREKMVQSQ